MKFNKVALLFISLILFLFGYPFVDFFNVANREILIIFSTIIPAAAIYAIGFTKHRLEIALSIGVPFIMVSWLYAIIDFPLWYFAHGILAIIFYLYAISVILHRLIKAETVTKVLLLGTVSIYLLFGILWSEVYVFIEYVIPNSFAGAFIWPDFLYYSFSTLTTLGIGDITPVSRVAKAFSVMESVGGVMFIAVSIARLVGVYVAQTTKREVKAVAEIKKLPRKKRVTKKIAVKKVIKKVAKKSTPKKRTTKSKAVKKK